MSLSPDYFFAFLSGDFEHGRGEIDADYFSQIGVGAGEFQGQIAGAAAQVQYGLARPHAGQLHRPATPATVQIETEQVIEQVVGTGDTGKHGPHPVPFIAGSMGILQVIPAPTAVGFLIHTDILVYSITKVNAKEG